MKITFRNIEGYSIKIKIKLRQRKIQLFKTVKANLDGEYVVRSLANVL